MAYFQGEITVTLDQARQNVATFQDDSARNRWIIDRLGSSAFKDQTETAASAMELIKDMQANGMSVYGLVSLMSELDQINSDAWADSTMAATYAQAHEMDTAAMNNAAHLLDSGSACGLLSRQLLLPTLSWITNDRLAQLQEASSKKHKAVQLHATAQPRSQP